MITKKAKTVFKKSGGLKRTMPVHFVPKGGSNTFCGRWLGTVFFTDKKDKKHIGCKVCLKALGLA